MSATLTLGLDGETDITRRFGRRILGSIPGRGTLRFASLAQCELAREMGSVLSCCLKRTWFSGKTGSCQDSVRVSITLGRTKLTSRFPLLIEYILVVLSYEFVLNKHTKQVFE